MDSHDHHYQSSVNTLLAAAKKASANAWSPHSHIKVGAAVVDESGNVFAGCNVESDSYGLTQCAERSALCSAIAAGVRPREMSLLVVYSPGERALPPCGACRQVMAEILAPDAMVFSICEGGQRCSWKMPELLPQPFLL